jgi:predicted site-specific integrase-resolvase
MNVMPTIKALDVFTRDMGVSPATVWRWRKQGILETVNLHGRQYVTSEQASRFVERLTSGEFARVQPVPEPPRKRGSRVKTVL